MKKRFSFISGLLILLVYGLFTLLALLRFNGSFSPTQNWLSDLGSQTLNPEGYFFYNTGIVLTGILLFFFFWSLSIWKKPGNKKQNIMLLLASLFGSLGGISMVLSAVFPINLPAIHSFFSAALYILIGTGFVFTVVSLAYYPKFPRWMLALGILVAVEDMLWSMVLNSYFMEYVTVGFFLIFTLLLGLHTRGREKFIYEIEVNMKKTVFITGASSGIGLYTALYFYEQGWNVIASMRNPEQRQTLLHEKGLPDLVHLDVTDGSSIQSALNYAVDKYQKIDVLVNNAGYAVYGPFEASTPEQIKKQYETNVFGLMEMTRAVLPVFRAQQEGLVINVTSMGGRLGFPLYSIYNSTKWAVEGFSEALQYELKSHNIRVKTIEPGVIKTDFYDRSLDRSVGKVENNPYADILGRAQKSLGEGGMASGSEPSVVAKAIFRAATDGSRRLRYPVGSDAKLVNFLRSILPARWLFSILEKFTLG